MEKLFNGFHPDGLGFLIGMAMQNEPNYFNANKESFEEYLKKPLLYLIHDLASLIKEIDPLLDTMPRRTLCRIRRDARFHPEHPYRTHMWFSFKPKDKGNSEYFTYHFYIEPDIFSMGIGFYSGAAKQMITNYKNRIANDTKLFEKVISQKSIKRFDLVGDDYKRAPKIILPKPVQRWYNKKNFSVHIDRPIEKMVFQRELLDEVINRYIDLVPLYDFVTGKSKVRFNFKYNKDAD